MILKTAKEMQEWSCSQHNQDFTIAFVPTMGALHEGHLSLLREGKKLADRLVLSIFINPAQFGPGEDLKKYPRDEKGDLEKANACGVDIVFMPTAETLYPNGFQTRVEVGELSKPLCGKTRPSHFQGVATVVLKLFNIVQPTLALFGQKDFQQLRIIQQMVKDLNLPIQIKPMPIVRESDGLAMSSRNNYLSPEERSAALAIPLSLKKAQALVGQGERNPKKILNAVVATLAESKKMEVDYISLCDPETLTKLTILKSPALLALACRVGKTRLIDNCLLS